MRQSRRNYSQVARILFNLYIFFLVIPILKANISGLLFFVYAIFLYTLLLRYNIDMCRQCFRERAKQIGLDICLSNIYKFSYEGKGEGRETL